MSSMPIKKAVCEDPSEDSNEDARPKVPTKVNNEMGNRKKQKTMPEGTIRVRFQFWNEEEPFLAEGSCREPVLKALRQSEHFKTTFTKSKNKGIRIYASEKLKAMVKVSLPCGLLPAGELLKITLINKKQPQEATVSGKDRKLFCIAARGKTENGDRQVILSCRYLKKIGRRLAVSAPEDQTLLRALQEDGRFGAINLRNIFYLRPPDKSGKCEPDTKVGLLKDSEITYTLIVTNPRNQPQEEKLETVETGQGDENSTSQSSSIEDTSSETSTSAQNQEMGTGIRYHSGRPIAQRNTNLRLQCERFANTFNEDKKFRQDFAASAEEFGKQKRKATLIDLQQLLAVLGHSVGYLEWGEEGGAGKIRATCFVLANRLIITNCHVLDMIAQLAKEMRPKNEVGPQESFHVTLTSLARVRFQYKGRLTPQPDIWHRVKGLNACNPDLDYALLELTPGGIAPPMGLARRISGDIPHGLVYIIGHPGGGPKEIDTCTIPSYSDRAAGGVRLAGPACQPADPGVANPDASCFHVLRHRQRYEEETDKRFPLQQNPDALSYDTWFLGGASGSPVFNGRGALVALHSNGYIGKYRWRGEYVLEFGYSMQAIWADIKAKCPGIESNI